MDEAKVWVWIPMYSTMNKVLNYDYDLSLQQLDCREVDHLYIGNRTKLLYLSGANEW